MNTKIIETFRQLLIDHDIPFTEHELWGGIQWRFPFTNGDVAYHAGTYHNDTCVESFGMPWDREDVTAVPPERMVEFLAHYDDWAQIDPEDITEENLGMEPYSLCDLLQSFATVIPDDLLIENALEDRAD